MVKKTSQKGKWSKKKTKSGGQMVKTTRYGIDEKAPALYGAYPLIYSRFLRGHRGGLGAVLNR